MSNNIPKYSVGDILRLNADEKHIKKILCVCDMFYDETGYSRETYYYIRCINDDRYPPSPVKESSIDKYYTKI